MPRRVAGVEARVQTRVNRPWKQLGAAVSVSYDVR